MRSLRMVVLALLFGALFDTVVVAEEALMRQWTDASGDFKVRARLRSLDGSDVQLVYEDGTEKSIPLTRLSDADKAYVKRMTSEAEAMPPNGASGDQNSTADGGDATMGIVALGLIALSVLFGLWSTIWWIVATFSESIGWGVACLFIPFATLFFMFVHWDRAKGPFLVSLLTLACVVGAFFALGGPEEFANVAD